MKRPRILVIAEAANPEWPSVPLVGWSHASALARVVQVHLVTQVRNREAVTRAGWPEERVSFIDSEAVAHPLYRVASLLRGGQNKGWTTVMAIQSLAYPYFEHLVWRSFEARLRSGEFDIVHRLTPLSPTLPSLLAAKVRRLGIPFVLGPLNGGVAWPKQFESARRREREWLSYLRGVYRLLPGYRSTRRSASAILCGSHATLSQMPEWCRERCIYLPENAVDPSRFPAPRARVGKTPLRVIFVGRLVPYKGADMLIEASAHLARSGRVQVEIVGDGPERDSIVELIDKLSVGESIRMHGWLDQPQVAELLKSAHLLGLPSIREFGGGVVLEAMAMGVVPLVVAYGGPAELITPECGIGVKLGSREEIVAALRHELERLCNQPDQLDAMSAAASGRVRALFTWEAKAHQVLRVYRWVMGLCTEKPDFGIPLREQGAATADEGRSLQDVR